MNLRNETFGGNRLPAKGHAVVIGDGAAAKLSALLLRRRFALVTVLGQNLFAHAARDRAQHAHSFPGKAIDNLRSLAPEIASVFDGLGEFDVCRQTALKTGSRYMPVNSGGIRTVAGGYAGMIASVDRVLRDSDIRCIDGASAKKVTEDGRVLFSVNQVMREIPSDFVVLATGRQQNIEGIELKSTHIPSRDDAWYASMTFTETEARTGSWLVCAHDLHRHAGRGLLIVRGTEPGSVSVSAVTRKQSDLPVNARELADYLTGHGITSYEDRLLQDPDCALKIWRSRGTVTRRLKSGHSAVIAAGDLCYETPPYRGHGFLHLSRQLMLLKEAMEAVSPAGIAQHYWQGLASLTNEEKFSPANAAAVGRFTRRVKSIAVSGLAMLGNARACERIFAVIHGYVEKSEFANISFTKLFFGDLQHAFDRPAKTAKLAEPGSPARYRKKTHSQRDEGFGGARYGSGLCKGEAQRGRLAQARHTV